MGRVASVPLPGFGGGWWWQDRWAGGSLLVALGFDLAHQHGGRDGGNGDGSGLGAALSIEDFGLVSCGDDAVESGLGSSHDADAAHQLVGAAVGVDAIDDERNDLEGLGRVARGDGEAGGDVFKVEAVGL